MILFYFAVPSFPGWAVKNWLPTLYSEGLHIDMAKAGPLATITNAGSSLLGVIVGGYVSDRWVQKNIRGRIFTGAIGLGLTIPALLFIGFGHSLFSVIAATFCFGFGFGIGMLIAVLYVRCPKPWWQALKRRRLTPIPLFCLSAPVLFKVGLYSPAQFLLLGVVFVFVVAGNDFFGLLSSKAVFLLGTVSYSFYITHGIVLFVFSHLFNRWVQIRTLSALEYWALIGVVGVTTVCFSTLLYWTVERRFMRRSPVSLPGVEVGPVAPSALEARPVSAGYGTRNS